MITSQWARESLASIIWEEGKIFPVVEGPYRYRVVVHCSANGRQKAMFANGEHNYFCYTELLNGKGEWIQQGSGIVPVLPDGRLLLVVEQRPAQSRYDDNPCLLKTGDNIIDLDKFGPHSSLEFPGGAINPGEGLKAGFLRELQEETEVDEQEALWYGCVRPVYLFGSDIALRHYSHVVFLSGLSYQPHVKTDGGLDVLALTNDEVQEAIWRGVITSGQAALTTWNFYKEVCQARKDPSFEALLQKQGYLAIEKVKIVKPA